MIFHECLCSWFHSARRIVNHFDIIHRKWFWFFMVNQSHNWIAQVKSLLFVSRARWSEIRRKCGSMRNKIWYSVQIPCIFAYGSVSPKAILFRFDPHSFLSLLWRTWNKTDAFILSDSTWPTASHSSRKKFHTKRDQLRRNLIQISQC